MTTLALRDRLNDIVSYGSEAIEAVGDLSADQILAERFREHTVLRTVQIVGEAAAQLIKLDPIMSERIPDLRRAIQLRNVLVHGYTKIRMDEIVLIVRTDMPGLVSRAADILGEQDT